MMMIKCNDLQEQVKVWFKIKMNDKCWDLNEEDRAMKIFGDVKSVEDAIGFPPPMMFGLK